MTDKVPNFKEENERQMENCVWAMRSYVETILKKLQVEVNEENVNQIGLLLKMAYVEGKKDFNFFVAEHKDNPNIKWGE